MFSWEEKMRAIVVLSGVMVAGAAQAEPRVFYTAHFPDQTSIQMSVVGEGVASEGGYDFDIAIGLAKISETGEMIFFDSSRHQARIRCAEPAYIAFGDHQFPMYAALTSDWKQDLWRAYCETPVS
jgi:hypothetical protein